MSKFHLEVLKPESFKLLQNISKNPSFENFFLAGGTSLALQIGHRISDDLDFFTNTEFKSNLSSKLDKPYRIINLTDNSIEVIKDNTKLMFFYFAFPLYKEVKIIDGIKFADPIDVGLMKLLALQGRTTRKDIIDLYFIDKEIIPLGKLLKIFETHFPKESFNTYSSIKHLFNLEDLEDQPMPKMIKDVKWKDTLDKVTKEVSGFINQLIA